MRAQRALVTAATALIALGHSGCFDWEGLGKRYQGAPDLLAPTDDGGSTDDLAVQLDLAVGPDLSLPVDFSGVDLFGRDLAVPLDLTVPRDLSTPADLSRPPDLSSSGGWTVIPSGTTDTLNGVWATSATDVWIIGTNYDLLHYDGVVIKKLTFPAVTVQYPFPTSVLATGPSDVYITTNNGAVLHSKNAGTDFGEIDLPTQELRRIFSAGTNLVAIGTGLVSIDNGNDNWGTSLDGATGGIGNYGFMGGWASSAMDIWTAGGPSQRHTTDGGNSWPSVTLPMPAGATAWSNAIWGSGPYDVYLVGDNGYIWRNKGSGWLSPTQPVPLPSRSPLQGLYGVWGPSASSVYAVGDAGTLIHTVDGGASWQQETTGQSTGSAGPTFYAVHGANGVVFVVGANGLVLRK